MANPEKPGIELFTDTRALLNYETVKLLLERFSLNGDDAVAKKTPWLYSGTARLIFGITTQSPDVSVQVQVFSEERLKVRPELPVIHSALISVEPTAALMTSHTVLPLPARLVYSAGRLAGSAPPLRSRETTDPLTIGRTVDFIKDNSQYAIPLNGRDLRLFGNFFTRHALRQAGVVAMPRQWV